MSRIARARPALLALAAALVVAGCAGEPSPPAAPPPPAVPPPPPVDTAEILGRLRRGGLDVSWHSGGIQWPAVVGDGPGFVFVKATEGVDLKDEAFDLHWPAVREAGLVRGAYHFYVTEDDPEEQARFFIRNVTLEPGDMAPVVDVELLGHNTPPDLPDRLRTFLEIVEEHYGIPPIIYTTAKFWDDHFDDSFGRYPLWVAEYDTDAPNLPQGWETWTLWQWKGDAEVKGVGGPDPHPSRARARSPRVARRGRRAGRALTCRRKP